MELSDTEHRSGILQSLVYCLMGYGGDVFIEKGDGFELNERCALSSQEREGIAPLCKLGFHVLRIQRFISGIESKSLTISDGREALGGLHRSVFLRSLCEEIGQVLHTYYIVLSQLNNDVLNNELVSISQFFWRLNEHSQILPKIADLVDEIQQDGLVGSQLIDAVHSYSMNGSSVVQCIFQRLLLRLWDHFFQLVIQWMIFGQYPSYAADEFFIVRKGTSGDNVLTAQEKGWLWDIGDPNPSSYDDFSVDPSKVPALLQKYDDSSAICEKVLFTGQVVRVLMVEESKKRSAFMRSHVYNLFDMQGVGWWGGVGSKQTSTPHFGSKSSNAGDRRSSTMDVDVVNQRALFPYVNDGEGTILNDNDRSYLKQQIEGLTQLTAHGLPSELNGYRLQNNINNIHTFINNKLWNLLIHESRLFEHVKALRDYMLCWRGDFIWQWIELLNELSFSDLKAEDALLQVRQIWNKAGTEADMFGDEYWLKFSPVIVDAGEGKQPSKRYEQWHCISLQMDITWPCHLLLTETCLQKHRTLFRFLMFVLRAKHNLQVVSKRLAVASRKIHAFMYNNKMGVTPQTAKAEMENSIAILRGVSVLISRMYHFIISLTAYLQVDVLEKEWQLLERRFQSCTFEGAKAHYDSYLNNLLECCFLQGDAGGSQPLYNLLYKIIAISTSIRAQLGEDILSASHNSMMGRVNMIKKSDVQATNGELTILMAEFLAHMENESKDVQSRKGLKLRLLFSQADR